MKAMVAIELEPEDFAGSNEPSPFLSMAMSQVVIYRGEVVKNRGGKTTRTLFEMLREERKDDPLKILSQ